MSYTARLWFPECGLMGMALITDYEPLVACLEQPGSMNWDIEKAFPGFLDAVMDGVKFLASKRFNAGLVTYLNFRVQVWMTGNYDADPSPFVRVLPKGVIADFWKENELPV